MMNKNIIKYEILYSIYNLECTYEQLCRRTFLNGVHKNIIDECISELKKVGCIDDLNGLLIANPVKTRRELNKN